MRNMICGVIWIAMLVSGDSVKVRWNQNTEPDMDKYRLYMSLEPIEPDSNIALTTWDIAYPDTEFTVTDLVEGQMYYFRVTAIDLSGNESDFSNMVSLVIPDTVAPKPPTLICAGCD